MKIGWNSESVGISLDQIRANIARAWSLGLPTVSEGVRPPLAVIGGGPSAADYTDELRGWPGEVWASGSAFPWAKSICRVCPTFFTIDPSPALANDCRGARKAIVATVCDKAVFDKLRGAQVKIFDLTARPGNHNHWVTSVTAVPHLALRMSYRDVTFYGCDSSFRKTTHTYGTDAVRDTIIVQCNGKSFTTRPSFVMQAEFMCRVIRMAPHVFKLRGDGLLSEMVGTPEYEVTHLAEPLAVQLLKLAA